MDLTYEHDGITWYCPLCGWSASTTARRWLPGLREYAAAHVRAAHPPFDERDGRAAAREAERLISEWQARARREEDA